MGYNVAMKIRNSKDLGAAIRTARRRSRLTQAKVAERLSMQQSTISRLEKGDGNNSLQLVLDVARVVGLDLEAAEPNHGRRPTPDADRRPSDDMAGDALPSDSDVASILSSGPGFGGRP